MTSSTPPSLRPASITDNWRWGSLSLSLQRYSWLSWLALAGNKAAQCLSRLWGVSRSSAPMWEERRCHSRWMPPSSFRQARTPFSVHTLVFPRNPIEACRADGCLLARGYRVWQRSSGPGVSRPPAVFTLAARRGPFYKRSLQGPARTCKASSMQRCRNSLTAAEAEAARRPLCRLIFASAVQEACHRTRRKLIARPVVAEYTYSTELADGTAHKPRGGRRI